MILSAILTPSLIRHMKFIKYFAALIAVAALLILFVGNFSAVETRFKCSGAITQHERTEPETIFMKLQEYRWWVGLWSKSDGAIWLEVPNKTFEYFSHIVEVGDQLQIYDYDKKPTGHFSTLSKSLVVSTPYWSFEGTCNTLEK